MPDAFLAMSNIEFMRVYRSRYNHEPALAARLDQASLVGRGRAVLYSPMSTSAPTSHTAKIAQERTRRGLVWPDSWIQAGLREPGEEF